MFLKLDLSVLQETQKHHENKFSKNGWNESMWTLSGDCLSQKIKCRILYSKIYHCQNLLVKYLPH